MIIFLRPRKRVAAATSEKNNNYFATASGEKTNDYFVAAAEKANDYFAVAEEARGNSDDYFAAT